MKIGIKVGPKDGIEILQKTQAKYCEVWFRIDKKDDYKELFTFLKENQIEFGLHFWGVVDGKYFPNLVYFKDGIADKTEALIRQTIDVASEVGAFYVNYHPECLRNLELDLDSKEIRLVPDAEVSEDEGFQSLLTHSQKLRDYAGGKNVDVYIETVPQYVPSHFKEGLKHEGRLRPIHAQGISSRKLIELGHNGFHLTFDIGHVTGQYPNEPRENIFEKVLRDAKEMAPYLWLVHVNTTIEPLNGTDSHEGILEDDFKRNVFPDRDQFMELMKVFKPYADILFIPEPQANKMIENYLELKKLFG